MPEPSDQTATPVDEPSREQLRAIVARPESTDAAAYVRKLRVRERMFGDLPTIGPYRLGDELGQGGMGVVVRARHADFPLDVALKVIAGRVDPEAVPDDEREAWQAHVHREARLLKQVRGEHVVAVHDVGIVDGLRWLAMTYIDGVDLEAWLAAQPRPIPWRTVLRHFLDAARGLASIHAAGLVHRDFKPGNAVLEHGRARVCVIDLGLATLPGGGEDLVSTSGALRPPHERATTQQSQPRTVRLLAGTPVYMSPEQRRGDRVDARSDQFSFCLALYWALHGRFPFADERPTADHLRDRPGRAVLPRRPPERADLVPLWLHRVLERGMSASPGDRFPSMDALIAELERDRGRDRRLALIYTLIAVVAVVAGVLLAPRFLARACRSSAAPELAAFAERRPALAARLAPDALAPLDRFRDAWQARWDAACDGHFSRGEPDPDLRQQCLRRQWQTFDRLGETLLTTEASPADILAAVHELPDPATCDAAGSNRAKPVPPAQREAVDRTEQALADARVAMWLGDYATAVRAADSAVSLAEASNHSPTRAHALHLRGELERRTGSTAAARDSLEQSHEAAITGTDVFAAIAATHELARTALLAGDRTDLADRSLDLAAAHLGVNDWHLPPDCEPTTDRECVEHTLLWAEHHDLRGLHASADLELDTSRELHDRAAVAFRGLGPTARPQLARALLNRGRAYAMQGDRAHAQLDYDESVRLTTELYGPGHPDLAVDFYNFAELSRQRGDHAAALQAADQARTLFISAEGETSAAVASVEYLVGAIHYDRADLPQARHHTELARAIYQGTPAVDRLDVLDVGRLLAMITQREGSYAEAAHLHTTVADTFADLGDRGSRCQEALSRLDAGKCLIFVDLSRVPGTIALAEQALAAAGGPTVCEAGYEIDRLRGDLATHTGDLHTAILAYEDALRDPKITHALICEIQWALAQNEVYRARNPAHARRLAVEARASFAALGPGGAAKTDAIDAWLLRYP